VSPPARGVAPLLLLALLAAGCPLPQAVPSLSGTTAAPPRILQDGSLVPAATRIPFDPGCARPQSFDVHASSVARASAESRIDCMSSSWWPSCSAQEMGAAHGAFIPDRV